MVRHGAADHHERRDVQDQGAGVDQGVSQVVYMPGIAGVCIPTMVPG